MTSGRRAKQKRKAEAKRHHVAPVSYLSGWANDRHQVQVINKATEKGHVSNVKNVAVRSKFYTLFPPDGTESNLVEDAMSKVEGAGAAVLSELREGTWPLSIESRVVLANLIAVQLNRGPGHRESLDRFLDQLTERMKTMKAHMEDLRANDPEKFKRISDHEGRMAELTRATGDGGNGMTLDELEAIRWQTPFTTLQASAGLVETVASMHWTLLGPEQGEFTTCDQPVVLWPDPKIPPIYGVGLVTALRTTFPISRCHCLELTAPSDEEAELPPVERQSRRTVPAEEVLLVNSMTTARAHTDVVMHPDARFEDVCPGAGQMSLQDIASRLQTDTPKDAEDQQNSAES